MGQMEMRKWKICPSKLNETIPVTDFIASVSNKIATDILVV